MGRPRNASRQTEQLLAILVASPENPLHGYEISKRTGLKPGTLYPMLIRLQDQGLLSAEWREPDKPGRPPRHVYRLTREGLVYARTVAAAKPAPVPVAALLPRPA
jgi:PadR family transcriptional regulator PadR